MKLRTTLLLCSLIFLGSLLTILLSCKHDIIYPDDYGYNGPCFCPEDTTPEVQKPCNPDTVYFQNQILPFIRSTCGISGCHDANSQGEAENLTTYSDLIASGFIKAGNASSSKLIEAVTEQDPQDVMPPYPYSTLTQEQINMLIKWINQGALNNYCTSCDTSNVHFSSTIWPIIRDNCKGCHSGTTPSKNVALTNYQEVLSIAMDNRLKGVLKGQGYKLMPPVGALNSCKVNQIFKWIDNGANND
jgi:hypothetical protein